MSGSGQGGREENRGEILVVGQQVVHGHALACVDEDADRLVVNLIVEPDEKRLPPIPRVRMLVAYLHFCCSSLSNFKKHQYENPPNYQNHFRFPSAFPTLNCV